MAKKDLLIVDGYNMIGSWPELVALKQADQIGNARDLLLQILSEYASFEGIEIWVVFDAQFVEGMSQEYSRYRLKVIFTEEGQTADSYIESLISEQVGPLIRVTVATSDLAEQRLVFQLGALRISARELYVTIKDSKNTSRRHVEEDINHYYRRNSPWDSDQILKLNDYLKDLSQKKPD